jgi:hypothetical protein
LIFSISQSATDLALLIAIQNYLNGLVVSSSKILPIKSNIKHLEGIRNFVILSSSTNKNTLTPNKKYNLSVVDFHFLKDVLIPFFDLLVFRTKKGLDYID